MPTPHNNFKTQIQNQRKNFTHILEWGTKGIIYLKFN